MNTDKNISVNKNINESLQNNSDISNIEDEVESKLIYKSILNRKIKYKKKIIEKDEMK